MKRLFCVINCCCPGRVRLFVTPRTAALQASLGLVISRGSEPSFMTAASVVHPALSAPGTLFSCSWSFPASLEYFFVNNCSILINNVQQVPPPFFLNVSKHTACWDEMWVHSINISFDKKCWLFEKRKETYFTKHSNFICNIVSFPLMSDCFAIIIIFSWHFCQTTKSCI